MRVSAILERPLTGLSRYMPRSAANRPGLTSAAGSEDFDFLLDFRDLDEPGAGDRSKNYV